MAVRLREMKRRFWVSGSYLRTLLVATVGLLVNVPFPTATGRQIPTSETKTSAKRFLVVDGMVTFEFDPLELDRLSLAFIAQGEIPEASTETSITFPVDASTTLEFQLDADGVMGIAGGTLATCGALLLDQPGDRIVLGNLVIDAAPDGNLSVKSTLEDRENPEPAFDLHTVFIEPHATRGRLWLIAELSVAEPMAARLQQNTAAADGVVGRLILDANIAGPLNVDDLATPTCRDEASIVEGLDGVASVGPDVLVADLQGTYRFDRVGDITAYAVATNACNIGTLRASWIANTNKHPVIIQNLYRLDDRGFQQIGMSWVKHGFYAVSQSLCSPCNDPTDGSQLGVGCSDPYTASLNGVQTNMSPRSTVNGHTGYFPYPWSAPVQSTIVRRLQVHDVDLDPALNPNARYFVEGHYVTADDAAAGNQDNNASYREIRVTNPTPNPNNIYNLTINSAWTTRRGQAAVRAWQDADPEVAETDIRVPGEGLFILAADVVPTGTGTWRYRYALQNLNSDRSARSFSVQLPLGGTVANTTFHDVEYHSGEPYDGTDWAAVFDGGYLKWSTVAYDVNPNANALRFDAIYSFSFESNVEPGAGKVTLGLFKPGTPTEVTTTAIGPLLEMIDCNENGVHDACELDCAATGCEPPCGPACSGGPRIGLSCAHHADCPDALCAGLDCNNNEVPDECEEDCNLNNIPDSCDISSGYSEDCQLPGGNTIPDECEPDCDGDGIPDTCETIMDTDGDGVDDCNDLCPLTTPVNACLPPFDLPVTCCFPSGIYTDLLTWRQCVASSGIPVCDDSPMCPGTPCPVSHCRDGCLIGDCDGDGDIDGDDFAGFLAAFGRREGEPGYDRDTDMDDDGMVTLRDYQLWLQSYRDFVGNPEASAPQPGALGDLDADGDVDLSDFAYLQTCIHSAAETSLRCIVKFDFDGNQKVDLGDFAAFQAVFLGPQ